MVVELTMIRHCDLPGFNCIIYLRYLIVPGLLAVGSGPFFFLGWTGAEAPCSGCIEPRTAACPPPPKFTHATNIFSCSQ